MGRASSAATSSSIVRPRRLRLEAASVCQLRCPDCPTATGETRPVLRSGRLRLEDFRNLLDRNPGLVHVELSNYGEPFLNPELPRIMECAFHRGVHLTADSGANLNTVREEVLEALVRYRFRRITCSIDGATEETYSKYRVGGHIATVVGNIRKINEYKFRYRSRFPQLTWQFIVFPHNGHEIQEARRLARQLGMRFREKLAWSRNPTDPQLAPIRGASGVTSRQEYRERYGASYMRGICSQLWRMPQVNWDGRVLGCCRNFWGEFGGNAFEDGIESIANSERMVLAREMLLGKQPPREDIPCGTCELYLGMREDGRWLTRLEVHLPAKILDWLYRTGLGNRFVIASAGSFCRVAEAAYFLLNRARRGIRAGLTGRPGG